MLPCIKLFWPSTAPLCTSSCSVHGLCVFPGLPQNSCLARTSSGNVAQIVLAKGLTALRKPSSKMSYTALWTRANFAFPTGITALVAGLTYLNIFTGRPATLTREISKSEYNVSWHTAFCVCTHMRVAVGSWFAILALCFLAATCIMGHVSCRRHPSSICSTLRPTHLASPRSVLPKDGPMHTQHASCWHAGSLQPLHSFHCLTRRPPCHAQLTAGPCKGI